MLGLMMKSAARVQLAIAFGLLAVAGLAVLFLGR